MSPGTEFARDFCTGIGPLQLGVVLVYLFFNIPKNCFLIYLLMKSGEEYMAGFSKQLHGKCLQDCVVDILALCIH